MDMALNNQERLICHKTQTTNHIVFVRKIIGLYLCNILYYNYPILPQQNHIEFILLCVHV